MEQLSFEDYWNTLEESFKDAFQSFCNSLEPDIYTEEYYDDKYDFSNEQEIMDEFDLDDYNYYCIDSYSCPIEPAYVDYVDSNIPGWVYDDDVLYDVFEGDPDNYWNIE